MAHAILITLSALLVVGGVLVLVTGWRGLRGTLPRNRYAGVRTPATMRDDETFRVGNKAAAPATLAGGGVLVLLGAFLPFPATATSTLVVALIGLIGSTALILAGGILGNRAATALPVPAGSCSGCPGGGCAALLGDSGAGACREG